MLWGLQFNGYIGRMAFSVRAVVVQHLKEANLLPPGRVPQDQLEIPMQLHRIAQPLLGREAEVQQVMGSLLKHHAAVIWGPPGEGKSSIAMEAGCRLWDAEKCLGGCFAVDCLGALQTTCSDCWLASSTAQICLRYYSHQPHGRRRERGERKRVCCWSAHS